MGSSFASLVEGFTDNPVASGKLLQRLFLDDPKQFLIDALPLLRSAPDTQGFYYILALLHSQNLILKNLCDPLLFNKKESIALARRMSRVEPLFDMKLIKLLLANQELPALKEKEQETQTVAGLRLLEIMSEVSDRGRSLLLAQLLHHSNPQVRSKAALLVGKTTQDVKWVSQRMNETDSRIRANAVEALWGLESEECRQVFLEALEDPANRVVGNGVLGLYRLGVPSAVGSMVSMVNHPDDGFKKTGFWVIGESGDVRFLSILARLMRESSPSIRSYVFRAFARLKQKRSLLAAMPGLRLQALMNSIEPGGFRELGLSVRSTEGNSVIGLKPTQFVIWESSDLILDYNVRSAVEKEPLSVAFAVPRNTLPPDSKSLWERALQDCLTRRRNADAWMILQYCPAQGSQPADQQQEWPSDLRFSVDAAVLGKAICSRIPRQLSADSLMHALSSLIEAAARGRGRRHLIFLDDGSSEVPGTDQIQAMVHSASVAEVAIHGISQRESPLHRLCKNSGGQWLIARSENSVPDLLAALYSYLYASYQLRFRAASTSEIRIEAFSEQGLGEVIVPA